MGEREKATADPFPHLPRRSFFTEAEIVQKRPPVKERVAVARESLDRSGEKSLPAATTTLPDTVAKEDRALIPEAAKRGRPKGEASFAAQKPWEAEGISRKTWYARRKNAKTIT